MNFIFFVTLDENLKIRENRIYNIFQNFVSPNVYSRLVTLFIQRKVYYRMHIKLRKNVLEIYDLKLEHINRTY